MDSLVMVMQRVPDNPQQGWRHRGRPGRFPPESTAIESFATWQRGVANIAGAGGQPERVFQTLTSANFFDVLAVPPTIGQGFRPGEDQPAASVKWSSATACGAAALPRTRPSSTRPFAWMTRTTSSPA